MKCSRFLFFFAVGIIGASCKHRPFELQTKRQKPVASQNFKDDSVEKENILLELSLDSSLPDNKKILSVSFTESPVLIAEEAQPKEGQLLVVLKAEGKEIFKTIVSDTRVVRVEQFNEDGTISSGKVVKERAIPIFVVLPAKYSGDLIEVYESSIENEILLKKLTQSISLAEKLKPSPKHPQGLELVSIIPTATVEKILDSGPAASKYSIVLLGDGYTAAEMEKWHNDAQNFLNEFFSFEPFSNKRNDFNVYRFDVVSPGSTLGQSVLGSNIGQGSTMAFGSFENLGYRERSLSGNIALELLTVNWYLTRQEQDLVLVIVNTDKWKGSGGTIPHAARVSSVISIHEIGHTMGNLADEYTASNCNPITTMIASFSPNLTKYSTRQDIKWRHLIKDGTSLPTAAGEFPNGTVGAFEGVSCEKGVFRPTENSMMRDTNYPFHAVNSEILSKAIDDTIYRKKCGWFGWSCWLWGTSKDEL